MFQLLQSAGCFAIPLSAFLFVAIFVTIDRAFALRGSKLGVTALNNFLIDEKFPDIREPQSVFERILSFFQKNHPEPEELRAYAELELNKLERGLFLLNIIISAAPLLGLLGTISGLMHVFSCFMTATEMSNETLANGIALALTTTALGLIIAVPTIIANNTIDRKLDKVRAAISLLIELLLGTR